MTLCLGLGSTVRVPVEVTTAVQASAVFVTGPGQKVEVSVSCQQAFLSAFREELVQRANITTSVVSNVTCSAPWRASGGSSGGGCSRTHLEGLRLAAAVGATPR